MIELEKRSESAIIRLVRPEIRNPLSVPVLEELDLSLDSLISDNSLRNIIFTGVEDVFASGADLREIASITPEIAPDFARKGQALMSKIAAAPQYTVAAVNGFCFGGALDLALACDRRIAAPEAVFSHPGVGLGIITGWGGTQRLPRLVGEAKALEMFLTAKRVTADEALRIGLVEAIADDPLSLALETAGNSG